MSAESARPSGSRHWWVLTVLSLAQLLLVLDSTVMNVALPSVQADLGFSSADRQWIVTAYALVFGGTLLAGGRLSDMLGRKRMLLTATSGFILASVLGGLANGFGMLVTARGLQGFFGALLAPAALSLMATTFTDRSIRGKAFGVFGAVSSSGAAIGLLLGGALTQYLDWRWCLLVNVVAGAVILAGAAALIPAQAPVSSRPRLDLPSVITSVLGVLALVYGCSTAERDGWTSPVTLGSLAAGVLLLGLFVLIQTRVSQPLLPMRVVRDRNRGAAYLMVAIAGIGMFGVFLFLAYHLQEVLGFSALMTGVAFLPMVVSMVVMAIVTGGVLLPRTGPRPVVIGGFLLTAVGTALFTGLSVHTGYAPGILPGLLITGSGFGLIFGPAMNLATDRVDPADAGAASALVNAGQQIGAAIGTALLNTIAVSATTSYLTTHSTIPDAAAQASVHGNAVAFWVTVAVFVLGALACGLLVRPGRQTGATGGDATATAAV
ncbi:MFS transporter [Streptomyces sp. SB3404]|uniref:MFS transporter n=2 Tax=Streptomyces boncukensis TaxID=2711219 RepID=A0A6G4X4I5_9ACTN|nr:MFS transporter [Streptomyces boncukensis]